MSNHIVKEPLYWDYEFPVLSASLVRQIAIPIIGVPFVLATLFAAYSIYVGFYEPIFGIYAGAFGFSVFLGLCYLVVAVITGNRLKVGYMITDQGLFSATIGAGRNGATILGGLLLAISSDMTLQGIGLLAQKRDAKFTPWEKVEAIRPAGPNKDLKLIGAQNRPIDRLCARVEDYDGVVRLIKRILAQRKHTAQKT